MNPRRANFLVWVSVVSIGLFYGMTLRAGHSWGDDFAMYIHHAKNIVEGRAYTDTGLIRNPYNVIGPKAYLPLFPLMLAPVYRLFGLNLEAMKVEGILCFMVALYALYRKSRRDSLPEGYGIALILTVGLHPFFWVFKDNVLSDIPFILFTYLAFWFFSEEGCSWKTALAIVCACETREVGWVLLIALFLWYAIHCRRPQPWAYAAFGMVATFSCLQHFWLRDSTYSTVFSFSRELILLNLYHYFWAIAALWQYDSSSPIAWAFFILLTSMALYGIGRRLRMGSTLMELTMALYLAVLLNFVGTEYSRYLIPFIPALLYYVFFGTSQVKLKRLRNGLCLAIMVGLAYTYGRFYRKLDFGAKIHGVTAPEARDLFQYVRDKTKASDIFIFEKPRALSLFTDRKASAYHSASYNELWAYAGSIGATYLITHSDPRDSYYLFAYASPKQCTSVYKNDGFQIWEITVR